jgi:hypothetical protein
MIGILIDTVTFIILLATFVASFIIGVLVTKYFAEGKFSIKKLLFSWFSRKK